MSNPKPRSLLSARLINSLRTHLETDLLLLGRIHYKNQSQHHLALFWRRAVEVDRVGRRLLPASEAGLKDGGAQQSDVRRLALLTSRVRILLSSCLLSSRAELTWSCSGCPCSLLRQLFKAALNLHSHALPILNLTHFLPLLTTLIAIASRVWTLSGVLYGHLEAVWARDFPAKRPLLPLEGWQEVPAATSLAELGVASASSSSKALTPALELASDPVSRASPALAVETGEVIQRSRTHTPGSSVQAPANPLPLDLGERIVRQSKLKPSPLATPAVQSPRPAPPVQQLPPVKMHQPSPSPPPPPTSAPRPSQAPVSPPVAPAPKAKTLKRPLAAVLDDDAAGAAPPPAAKLKKASSAKKAAAAPTAAASASPFDSLLVPKKAPSKASSSGGVVKKKKRKAAGDDIDAIFG